MEQVSATYYFKEKYTHNYTRQETWVKLDIDYRGKSYSITPFSSTDGTFNFTQESHRWEEWKAKLKAIEAAIDFANEEVGNTPKAVLA